MSRKQPTYRQGYRVVPPKEILERMSSLENENAQLKRELADLRRMDAARTDWIAEEPTFLDVSLPPQDNLDQTSALETENAKLCQTLALAIDLVLTAIPKIENEVILREQLALLRGVGPDGGVSISSTPYERK